MRLTLRTLLAYLDNTLDPQDADALRAKLGESGFATQLVQRIRSMLTNQTLPAPSPQAVGPVEEANVISEYLDSTLPAEQVAEIERACLESDPHLAEAAACHQILTMVLGKPAEVSAELRNRIYELPDRKIEDIVASAGSFSSVAIPSEEPSLHLSDGIPTSEVSALESQPVVPVGISDSGVSDAPTRLRESGAVDDIAGGDQAIAGSRARALEEEARTYGGSIRPSRIAPWLVSLALAGVFLFALTRIFKPLLTRDGLASVDPSASVEPAPLPSVEDTEEIEVPAGEAPLMTDIPAPEGAVDEGPEDMDELPAPSVQAETSSVSSTPATDAIRAMEAESEPVDSNPADEDLAESVAPPIPEPMTTIDLPDPKDHVVSDPKPSDGDVDEASPLIPPKEDMVDSDAAEPPAIPKVMAVGKFVSSDVLLMALVEQQWIRLKKDVVISSGVPLVCAPTFRSEIETKEDAKLVLIGPAQLDWIVDDEGNPVMRLQSGRLVVSATKPDTKLRLELGGETVILNLNEEQSVAAASVTHFRADGFDPLKPTNRIPLRGILSLQGTVSVDGVDEEQSLNTLQQWVKRGAAEAVVSDVDSRPKWVDAPDPADATLEANAREGLLELLQDDKPLEIGLREASLFRRSEVVSLASQTLLHLGRGDVYFSGDGILSESKQKAYWTDHYKALLSTIDRSAESAEQLQRSIVSMDSANADALFRLLAGYSQKQLVEGGDEELVEMLNSSSMPVRILALENLRKITGTTLYFRPEQENSIRRAKDIKKWEARQRKGDIRWKE